jgi:DNA-binding MarR family transcriptional regulator
MYRYLISWHDLKNNKESPIPITPSLIALLSNIYMYGNNNKLLAERVKISKQAMSKLLKDTAKEGIIKISRKREDNRSNDIHLTAKGAKLLLGIWKNNRFLLEDIEIRIGKQKAQMLLGLLNELSDTIGPCE